MYAGTTARGPRALACHPATPSTAVRSVAVTVTRAADGALALAFLLAGDLDRVRVPAPQPPGIDGRLWEHTCVEAFIGLPDAIAYHEVNAAPSGAWAVFAFTDYRAGALVADPGLAPPIAVRRVADRLAVDVRVPVARLAADYGCRALVIGLAAVIEDHDGGLSYWALAHPAPLPDFHHRDARTLRVEPPAAR